MELEFSVSTKLPGELLLWPLTNSQVVLIASVWRASRVVKTLVLGPVLCSSCKAFREAPPILPWPTSLSCSLSTLTRSLNLHEEEISPGLSDELKTFLKAAGCKLVVVEFSAKWCGPCQKIYPLVHAMSLQYRNVMFAKVDVDDSQELAQTYHIKAVPTFQMFKQAHKIFEFCGADAQKLEAKIRELMLIPPFCNLAAKLPKALVVSEDVSLPFSDLAFFPLFVHISWAMFS
ncbi:thioredoxin F2, chloroplastic-like [Ursus maritimus]|uniref:Thioredoxin F2, chloroplastic-like n=2 Tax=Ursus maritimus TaxID=29073 RepID=A0A8M1FV89_URSMA|nr:thioredoxin F2, chloroplastic-like [Ursus maritimus]